MYITQRTMKIQTASVFKAPAVAVELMQLANDRFGAQYGVSIQVGGEPDVVAVTARWETLGAYDAFRAAMTADADFIERLEQFSEIAIVASDRIGRVVSPPGDRLGYSAIVQANMKSARIADAIPFALEICEFVESKTGAKVGLVTPLTGNRSEMAWVAYYPDLDSIAAATETLGGDPEYLDLMKRSGEVLVDGSATSTILQLLS